MEMNFDNKTLIHSLIDILWTDVDNTKVINKSYEFIKQFGEVPEHLQRCYEMMEEFQKPEHSIFHPFSILHPYERALEGLEPEYFRKKRSIFYKEDFGEDRWLPF